MAKIYHTSPDQSTIEKLIWMIANPPAGARPGGGVVVLAWPQALLKDKQTGSVVGFTMPLIDGAWEITRLYDPALRKALKTVHGERFGWHHLHEIACNLARVVEACHSAGYVIGDLNNNNTRVSAAGQISLIDTDSFQVTVTKGRKTVVHRCNVGLPEYTPPEFIGKNFRTVSRDASSDRFILAILIFRLLQNQMHPFSGETNENPPPDAQALIARGWYPYDTSRVNQRIKAHADAPPFGRLHPRVRELFQRCFGEGLSRPQLRPSAKEWVDALTEARASLKRCLRNHHYCAHSPSSICLTRVGAGGKAYCGSTSTSMGSQPIPADQIDPLTGQKRSGARGAKTPPVQTGFVFTPPIANNPPPNQTPLTATAVAPTPSQTTPAPGAATAKRDFGSRVRGIGRGKLLVLAAMAAIVGAIGFTQGFATPAVERASSWVAPLSGLLPGAQDTDRGSDSGLSLPNAARGLLRSDHSQGLIVLSTFDGNAWALNLLDPAEKELVLLLRGLAVDPVPVWDHDGENIAFILLEESRFALHIINRRTGSVTFGGYLENAVRVTRLAWSSDNSTIFVSMSNRSGLHIRRFHLTSGNDAAFYSIPSTGLTATPSGLTAFSIMDGDNWDIVESDDRGRIMRTIASSSVNETDPSYGENGSMIVFDSSRVGSDRHRVVIKNGVHTIDIPSPSDGQSWISTIPVWTADGDGVAFAHCVPTRCRVYLTKLISETDVGGLEILLSTQTITDIGALSWQPRPQRASPISPRS